MAYEHKEGSGALFTNDGVKVDVYKVPGKGDLYISRCGKVFRFGKEKTLTINKVGYKVVTVSINNKSHTRYLHRMMLETFVSACPDKCEALHINGNPLDNRLENLRWGTRKENVSDAIKHGTATIGTKNGGAKLTLHYIKCIKDMWLMGFKSKDIAPHFGVSRGTINKLISGKAYKNEWQQV